MTYYTVFTRDLNGGELAMLLWIGTMIILIGTIYVIEGIRSIRNVITYLKEDDEIRETRDD